MRFRIAPSPTGDPHVGTAYTALFNFIAAKQIGGQFILRIEDTDQSRKIDASEHMIMQSLQWLGLTWDEGPDIGGPYGPYRQSERQAIYKDYADRLVSSGAAYRCFCSTQRLDVLRKTQRESKQKTKYDKFCLSLRSEEVNAKLNAGQSHVIRLNVPASGSTAFKDELRGEIRFDHDELDDQVLMKADGFPTYHLANVVDDHLMKITHVIRAEEWLSSTPKHVLLYAAFGWQQPQWIHLPLLRNLDKSKISKRKNPVSLRFFEQVGILPEALLNFLALMGWNPGGDVEKFDLELMKSKFRIGDIHLGSPVFDWEKLLWLNQQYLKELTPTEFAKRLMAYCNDSRLQDLHPLLIERITKLSDVFSLGYYFLSSDLNESLQGIHPAGMEVKAFKKHLADCLEKLDVCHEWNAQSIQSMLDDFLKESGLKAKELFLPLRLIVSGRKDSPPLAEMIASIGKEIFRYRVRGYIQSDKNA